MPSPAPSIDIAQTPHTAPTLLNPVSTGTSIPVHLLTEIEIQSPSLRFQYVKKNTELHRHLGKNQHDLWSYVWLTSFVLGGNVMSHAHSALVQLKQKEASESTKGREKEGGVSVLEIGGGSGLSSLICSKVGFNRVVMTDFHPMAVELGRHNSRLNGLDVRCEVLDWDKVSAETLERIRDAFEEKSTGEPSGGGNDDKKLLSVDVIVGSDVLFMSRAARSVRTLLSSSSSSAILSEMMEYKVAVLVDPGRCYYQDLVDGLMSDGNRRVEVVRRRNVRTEMGVLEKCVVVVVEGNADGAAQWFEQIVESIKESISEEDICLINSKEYAFCGNSNES